VTDCNNARLKLEIHSFYICFYFCFLFLSLHCFLLFCLRFLLLCCLVPTFVQVYRPLPPCLEFLYRIQTKSIKKMENKGRNSFTPLSMTVTPPIFTKLARVRPFIVKKSYTEFHDSSAKGLLADTR
jgi:hypothetical protein